LAVSGDPTTIHYESKLWRVKLQEYFVLGEWFPQLLLQDPDTLGLYLFVDGFISMGA
jgi:hypothetical protein